MSNYEPTGKTCPACKDRGHLSATKWGNMLVYACHECGFIWREFENPTLRKERVYEEYISG